MSSVFLGLNLMISVPSHFNTAQDITNQSSLCILFVVAFAKLLIF